MTGKGNKPLSRFLKDNIDDIYKMAVQAGVDPVAFYDMTLSEIHAAVEGYGANIEVKDRHVARICWVIAEVNRNPKKKRSPFKESDFMPKKPGQKKQSTEEMAANLKMIAAAFGCKVVYH